ncbi:MAG: hypothetical protein GY757_58190 [bacterium]|nr:hypothetical protein [bacterium]
MTYLILAIACSTFIHLFFKVLSRYRIDLFGVIVLNYAMCIIIGYNSSVETLFDRSVFTQSWYPFSILQGIIFACCFFLLGRTTEKQGVTVATIATRLSVAIPTAAAFFLYNDQVTVTKLIGIATALFALYLSCTASGGTSKSSKTLSILPFTLFMIFGFHATLLKFVQAHYLGSTTYHTYIMSAFLSAFIISATVLAWKLLKQKQGLSWKELTAGLLLGLTNYGAIYFLVRALSEPGRQSSQLFPTISISVVILSAFGAWALFNERPGRRMAAALVTGAVSILVINWR